MKLSQTILTALTCAVMGLSLTAHAAVIDGDENHHNLPAVPLATNQYLITNVTVNAGSGAPNKDANLVNPWGLSRSSGSPWWVSDNGTGLATLYSGAGVPQGLVVTIPPAKAGPGNQGTPTGTIFNGTQEFALPNGNPAVFLFATEDGTISGWNGGTAAVIVVNEFDKGAAFKGLTAAIVNIKNYQNQTLLYAADFTLGKVEVFNSSFGHVKEVEEEFSEDLDLPTGFSPFNVQNLGGNIYVSYAKRGSGADDQKGPGLGFVRIYSPSGKKLLQLEHGSFLDAPWGMAIAPSDFGPYTHSILVGNFGSGMIAAFNPVTGRFQDFLRDKTGAQIVLPGLWAISPGNDGRAGNATALYFTAGGATETEGILGTITALTNQQGNHQ
jgi:uncharacterized protein (TIGR03118 family)